MAEILLTQTEGDALLAMEKISTATEAMDLPDFGGTLDLTFHSRNGPEEFIVNFTRHTINLSKRNHHMRAKKVVGLARLDLDGPPHRNPDGEEIGARHLHLYREGFGLKWAFDIPDDKFTNLDDTFQTLQDFLSFCNVVQMPDIRRGLFT